MVQETQPLKTQVPVRCRWSVFVNRRDHVDIITRSWQTTTVAVDKDGVGGVAPWWWIRRLLGPDQELLPSCLDSVLQHPFSALDHTRTRRLWTT